MKHPLQRDETTRFQGSLRHYHRTSAETNRSWEQWVDAKAANKATVRWAQRLKVIGAIMAVLLLVGLVAGLYIELS